MEPGGDPARTNNRLAMAHRNLHVQHDPAPDHLRPCQPVLAHRVHAVSADVVGRVPAVVHVCVWCAAACSVHAVWVGAANHHAQADEVHGRVHAPSTV